MTTAPPVGTYEYAAAYETEVRRLMELLHIHMLALCLPGIFLEFRALQFMSERMHS